MIKQYGELKCPHCSRIFFEKKKLDGHIGGAHRKGITSKIGPTKCKKCGDRLVPGKNWAEWAQKQYNLICTKCKNAQNRESYRKKMKYKKQLKEDTK